MKTFTKFLTMLAVAALFATGCVNEEPPYKEDPNPEPAGTTGYLSIGNLSMTVVYDETEIRPDDTSDETQAARIASGTRATAPDVDSFIVEILDADNAQVLEMTYAQLKEQLKTPMELKVGAYRMEVRSEDTMPDAAWEHPVYGATSDFTITKAQTTSPEEVVCTLQNIKVSVEYSSELADMLADTSKATVSLGDTSLDFLKTETRAAYFKPLALENTLDFVFDGTFADTDVPAKFSKQITGVKAGQWRKVSVVIGYADKGNILFSVKVDNSILQDNKFVVDGTENLGEELLEDPNAPALTWPGHDMTQPFTLTDAMFDAEGNCIEPFAFDLSSPNGIESLQVTVGSTNSQFLASMAAIQLPETFDLCTLDASSAAGIILKGFGYPVGSELKGQTAKSFNIAGQIRALYEFDGTHTFAFTMTDAKGVSSEAVLTLVVDKSSGQTGPRITWRGYDIDQQYEVQKDMVIDIDIEADKGIKSFFVTIDSETLRPLLPVINLPEKFDICDIPDELVNTEYLDMLLDEASVTGTANIVMAAVMAKGRTTIYNAACEPYLQQLCKMLNRMGAKISGIASNLLEIEGVEALGGTEHRLLPDMIEVGSFIGMAAMNRSELTIKDVSFENLGIIPAQFARMGIRFEQRGDDIHIPQQDHYSIDTFLDGSIMTIADAPWPGLTPDLLSIFLVVATQANGAVLIHQKMFESRLFFVDKLIDMGAQIILCDPHRATVIGHDHRLCLRATRMTSPDIRAGVALLIAAMSAEGVSTIQNIDQIDRGYKDIDGRLNALGAKITRIDDCK